MNLISRKAEILQKWQKQGVACPFQMTIFLVLEEFRQNVATIAPE